MGGDQRQQQPGFGAAPRFSLSGNDETRAPAGSHPLSRHRFGGRRKHLRVGASHGSQRHRQHRSPTPRSAHRAQGIADNFDTFLQLLTTQLKNQNPLDPLDTNAFTQQLVQFSSVEQQLKTNDFLSALVQANTNSVQTNAVNYIGKTVTAEGTRSELVDGKAVWNFSLEDAANVNRQHQGCERQRRLHRDRAAAGRRGHLRVGRQDLDRRQRPLTAPTRSDDGHQRRGQERPHLDRVHRHRHRRRLHRHRAGAADRHDPRQPLGRHRDHARPTAPATTT